MMTARHALAMGAAVLAAVPVVISPLTVSATWSPPASEPVYDGYVRFRQIVDALDDPLYLDERLNEYVGALTAAVYGAYASDVLALAPAPDNLSCVGGYYTDGNGKECYGIMYISSRTYHAGTPPAVPYIILEDDAYYITITPDDPWEGDWQFQAFTSSGDAPGYIVKRWWNGTQYRLFGAWEVGSSSDTVSGYAGTSYDVSFGQRVSAAAVAPVWPGIATALNSSSPIFGRARSIPTLPTDTNYPTLTPDNIGGYIENVLNPAYPDVDLKYYPSGDPVEPTETPIYPTDFVEGIPKAWTVENPRLPSYSLDLQLPTADFDTVDVSTPLEQHATGIRFWWAMLGEVLDHFGVKELVVFALALGLIVTILTRLGR